MAEKNQNRTSSPPDVSGLNIGSPPRPTAPPRPSASKPARAPVSDSEEEEEDDDDDNPFADKNAVATPALESTPRFS